MCYVQNDINYYKPIDLLKYEKSTTYKLSNHDSFTTNFEYHFNTPNSYHNSEYTDIIPGYNYFFKYITMLLLWFCKRIMIHRIAMFHHDIYENGEYHSHEFHITDELYPCLTKLFDKNHFELAINGHDHVYSASQFDSYTNKFKKESEQERLSITSYEINKKMVLMNFENICICITKLQHPFEPIMATITKNFYPYLYNYL
ncbi:hypothetical protein H8356DRAFT_1320649 [Neocallimastix lanati (nom. inval.)]|nr:hypothetical protein H8356DRAFT_1320649 [Neocallimastix sp. JGI-2020a]